MNKIMNRKTTVRVTINKKISNKQLQQQIDSLLLLYKQGKLNNWCDY